MSDLRHKRNLSLLTIRPVDPVEKSNGPAAFAFTNAVLLVKEITGTLLSGVGVTVVIGNLLIASAVLLRGPAFVIGLLNQ